LRLSWTSKTFFAKRQNNNCLLGGEAMPKYYLYAHKSTDDEDRQILSIESQLNELREFAKRENLFVIEEFIETKTAKKPGRPIFDFMVK
jgi:hypothetical protein